MEKTNKVILVLFIILLILIGALTFIFFEQTITGRAIGESESFTTAICNGTNFCQDYKITCQDNEILDIVPISGATVKYSLNWDDPRNKTELNRLCQ